MPFPTNSTTFATTKFANPKRHISRAFRKFSGLKTDVSKLVVVTLKSNDSAGFLQLTPQRSSTLHFRSPHIITGTVLLFEFLLGQSVTNPMLL